MSVIDEAKKWLETDYGSCSADITAASEVVGDLVGELEQKDKQQIALEDALKKSNLALCDTEEKLADAERVIEAVEVLSLIEINEMPDWYDGIDDMFKALKQYNKE